jgi:hypothetical protein
VTCQRSPARSLGAVLVLSAVLMLCLRQKYEWRGTLCAAPFGKPSGA